MRDEYSYNIIIMHIAWAVGVLNGSAIGFEVHQFNRSPRMLGTMKRTFSVSLFAVVYCRRASLFPYLVRPYSFCFIVSTRRTQFWASIIRFFWRARTASDCACDWHRSFCIILILFCFFFFSQWRQVYSVYLMFKAAIRLRSSVCATPKKPFSHATVHLID